MKSRVQADCGLGCDIDCILMSHTVIDSGLNAESVQRVEVSVRGAGGAEGADLGAEEWIYDRAAPFPFKTLYVTPISYILLINPSCLLRHRGSQPCAVLKQRHVESSEMLQL